MKQLAPLNKYFWKYRYRFFIGILFVIGSNYFAVLAPEITGYVVSKVQQYLTGKSVKYPNEFHGWIVSSFINWIDIKSYSSIVLICSLTILAVAILRGVLMFFMRQTIIVMSRHIEYDQKNEVYSHYQKLDAGFYKTHSTGDLMNRISEDVSRVRMYTGPSVMYLINLTALISFCLVNMLRKDVNLTLIVFAPLPVLAITIYIVNTIINKKSEKVQALLSDLTTNAQESYSGIRVIKSFVQEKAMLGFFEKNSEEYRKHAVSLAKTEAVYFPSMSLMIGLSTLLTVLIGGQMALTDPGKVGVIVEFVIYINMLTFPVSSIGWVASMIQRAAASQKRLNEFLQREPVINNPVQPMKDISLCGDIVFKNVSFIYPNTGIKAVKNFSLRVKEGEKVLIVGRTGSGKSTLAQLLLRFYDPDEGDISIGKHKISDIPLEVLRNFISYVPQDVFLFSDSVANNIGFGLNQSISLEQTRQAAMNAAIDDEILGLQKGYQTAVGERGVNLSGGQKQRISIARALVKEPQVMLFDDCLSAVDTKTENSIINNLYQLLNNKTAIIITHRIFTVFNFSRIIIIDDGEIIEQGTHAELIQQNGYYAQLYQMQGNGEKYAG